MSNAAAVVAEMQARWSAAYDQGDWRALTALYRPDAQLFGGKPGLYEGAVSVHDYFQVLKPGGQAVFGPETSTVEINQDVVACATIVDFRREGRERPHRLTWTLVRTSGEWRIASHHASPVPATT